MKRLLLALLLCIAGCVLPPADTIEDPIHDVEPELPEPEEPAADPEPPAEDVVLHTRRTPAVVAPSEKLIGATSKNEVGVMTLDGDIRTLTVKTTAEVDRIQTVDGNGHYVEWSPNE